MYAKKECESVSEGDKEWDLRRGSAKGGGVLKDTGEEKGGATTW